MTEDTKERRSLLPVAFLIAVLVFVGVYLGMHTGLIPSMSGALMPTMSLGYSSFDFAKDPKLVREFESEVTSSAFIEELFAGKPQYSDVKSEFMKHWKPVIARTANGGQLVNSATANGNVTLDLSDKHQAKLYSLRQDVYARIRALMDELNKRHADSQSPNERANGRLPAPSPD